MSATTMPTVLAALFVFAAGARAQDPGAAAAPRGVQVTFERLDDGKVRVVQRQRLLSLAVERGETPSPLFEPGLFRATFRARIELPLRDRHRFRVEGRGTVELSCNGERALGGALRPGKPLETAEPVRLKKGANDLVLVFESQAPGDGEFRLSWSGPDFGFEPIAPERLSWPGDDTEANGARLRAGQQLFTDRHCARCHEPEVRRIGESAFAELDAPPPDLRTIGARVRADWIAAWLRDPRAFRPDTAMPKVRFAKNEDVDDVAAYLASLGAPIEAPPFAADAAENGEARFLQLGCNACHTAPAEARAASALGARLPLDFVAAKWRPVALVSYLQDPRRDHAGARMPDFGLSHDDAVQIAAFLLATPGTAPPPSHGSAERGKKVVEQHDCVSCHALDVPITERKAARLRNLKLDRGCLHDKGESSLDHGLSEDDRAALRAFLPFAESAPFRRSPLDYVARNLHAQRCTACHALDGEPSAWARVAERAAATAPLLPDQDPVAQGLPALTWVGGKLQPSWATRFVTGQLPSPRPWLHAKMPAFHARGAAMVAGLVREHGYSSTDEQPQPVDAQSAVHGERLVQIGKGLGCVQCHALADKPAVQVFERAGIELTTARTRLRHEYFTRWLRDPPRLSPDSRMPKYADQKGRTAITDVLDGDATQQFEAIWQFLGSKLERR